MGWLIAIGALVAYLVIGQILAKLHVSRAWRAARLEFSYTDSIRESVTQQILSMMFAWPVYQIALVVIFVAMCVYGQVVSRVDKMADEHDPAVKKQRELEYRARINNLEREAGVPVTKWSV